MVSGGADVAQMAAEVKSMTSEDRLKMVAGLEFQITIPALSGLALKTDLCLPWNKMRAMKR